MKKIAYAIVSLLFVSSVLFLNSCEDNEIESQNNQIEDQIEDQTEYTTVPFFELAKGDTIGKDVFREKPEFSGVEESSILYCSETGISSGNLKSLGDASNPNGYPLQDLTVSISRKGGAPSGYINVDLNEGAGGKWIYLGCSFYEAEMGSGMKLGFDQIDAASTGPMATCAYSWFYEVANRKGTNFPADLNDGAGGDHIRLLLPWSDFRVNASTTDVVRQIRIATANHSSLAYSGWTRVNKDLNKGCGGKYIYLFYKKY